ncbi:mediator complex, subunit Med21 [Chaetomium strumarium]|uniref:Mediator of RNA polymerase II transcription subunit 21 n=1 Tax=Chaetomium strumarium TaxID=1170767 RepID=A0AAJ0GV51_9PEZI|nr:mediator complex, subunit Med21 [Chaetomium strumarium]
MADILTQLQEAMDTLCTMFIAGFYYVERHHDLKPFSPTDKIPELKDAPKEVETLDPQTFQAGQAEIANDLVNHARLIEALVSALPGLDNSERDQLQMIRDLEEEIAEVETQRLEAVKERDEVLEQLDGLLKTVLRH